MTQTYTDNCYQAGNVGQTDLQNIENNFATLKSNFSGTSAPANTVAGMCWFDMDSGTANEGVLKVRDDGNSAWFGLLHGDTTHLLLVYRNTAIDGWAVNSTVTDKVVAIKGGSTYTTGGTTAGSWSITGISVNSHNHKWYNYVSGSNDESYDTDGNGEVINCTQTTDRGILADTYNNYKINEDLWTNNSSPSASGNGNWRIAAAVHTHQYIDI